MNTFFKHSLTVGLAITNILVFFPEPVKANSTEQMETRYQFTNHDFNLGSSFGDYDQKAALILFGIDGNEQGVKPISKFFFSDGEPLLMTSITGQSVVKPLSEPLDKQAAKQKSSQSDGPLLGLTSSDKPFDHNPWESWLWWIGVVFMWVSSNIVIAVPHNVKVRGAP